MVGDLDRSSPEVVALIATCADCKERLGELASVAGLLDAAGREQRETIEQARSAATPAPGADRIESAIEEFARRSRPRRFTRGLVLAIAAAAAIVMLLLFLERRPSPAPDYHLGTDALTELSPQGSVRDYDVFSWKFTLPQNVYYDLVIYDDTPAGKGRKVLEKKALRTPSWRPEARELEALPAAIRWEVRARDDGGGSWTASARCSSSAR
jgi:hypothetical protein